MPKVISVKFNNAGKTYYFDPQNLVLHIGDTVIVETSQGVELGYIVQEMMMVLDDQIKGDLKPILRLADHEDLARQEERKEKESQALVLCQEKIEARGLDMQLVGVEYGFDGKRLLFYFTAEGRIDFRELVKDLAAIFRTRIELRQIGVRDQAKMAGGLGLCGRELCCSTFLSDFVPVSIKMAKEQNLSMNPTKISGACGRLMCCLKYEQDAYEDAHKRLPAIGDIVMTPQGQGCVLHVDLLREKVSVRLELGDIADLALVAGEDITIIESKNRKKHKGCGSGCGCGQSVQEAE